jgi:hypothetical protein
MRTRVLTVSGKGCFELRRATKFHEILVLEEVLAQVDDLWVFDDFGGIERETLLQ